MPSSVSMFSLLGALVLSSPLTVTGQVSNTPLYSIDVSTSRTADASIQNGEELQIILDVENESVTAISNLAETDFDTPQVFGRPNTDSTTADASINNQGDIFVSALGFGFGSAIESKAEASIFVPSSVGPSTANANALAAIINEGSIYIENGGLGLATSVRVDSTATTNSSAPTPARSFASATGDGSIENYSDIQISHPSYSFTEAISTNVKSESSAIGTVFWTIPAPDPLIVIIEAQANAMSDASVLNHGNLTLNTMGFGNSSAIRTKAESITEGIVTSSRAKADVLSTGDISITLTEGFFAHGIHTEAISRSVANRTGAVSGESMASVQNFGDINIFVQNSLGAYGIRTQATMTATARNGGTIKLKADTSVSNHGTIGVHAFGKTDAYGIYTRSSLPSGSEIELFSDVYNTGSVFVEALGSESEPISGNAIGVYFYNGGNLYSSGLIEAYSAGGTSYHVVSEKDLTISGYAMQFGPDVVLNYTGVIKAEEAVLFDDAVLFASISEDFVGGVYEIPELVEGTWSGADNGGPEEQFASVVSQIELPDFKVELLPADSSSGQRVDIRYAPSASFANQSMRLTGDLVQQATFRLRQRQLLSAHSNHIVSEDDEVGGFSLEHETSASGGRLYGSPVYSNSRVDSDPVGYRSDTYGFELGYTHGFSNRLNLGLIGGYSESSVDFTGESFDRREEDTELIYGGVDGVLRLSDRLALLGSSIYYETSNSYKDRSPSNLESADYRGHGVISSLSLSYKLPIADTGHWLMPRIGISHLWQSRESFVTSNEVTADVAYGDISEDHFYSHFGVDWNHRYELENWTISPHFSLEVRKALGDDDLSHDMSVGNSYSRVTDTRDSLLYQGLGSISIYRDNCDFTAGVGLHESDDSSAYALWLRFGYQF